jgi:hypothetical protein
MVGFAALGVLVMFFGTDSVSAKRAEAGKGEGCYVRTGTGDDDYAVDAACEAPDVLKMEDENTVDFYVYQDHGKTSWHPEEIYRATYEQCLNFSFGTVCGTVKETVTPSGEYKSSFKSH